MPSQLLAELEIIICLILFGACALHVRFRFESAKSNRESSINIPH